MREQRKEGRKRRGRESGKKSGEIKRINQQTGAVKPILQDHAYLKPLLRSLQQQTTNEDVLEECTQALSQLVDNKEHKKAQQGRFERLCMQHFSPCAPVMVGGREEVERAD